MTEPTTVNNIGVAMFTVSDQDEAISFYTDKLGYELRADVSFGEGDSMRWVEVAPPGSNTRLALNEPMEDGTPGGSSIGVETDDMLAEHRRLSAVGGVDIDPAPMPETPGVPPMFMLRDPDGNTVVVVQAQEPA
ncbi:MAG: VOC family protein [Solirubrobacterales bacterium]|nr:VOC family protein [Solirubrobacterales bacterium]